MPPPPIILGPESLGDRHTLIRYYTVASTGRNFSPTIPGVILDIMHLPSGEKVLILGRPGRETGGLRHDYDTMLDWLSQRAMADRCDSDRRTMGQFPWNEGCSWSAQPMINVIVSASTVKDSMASTFTENGCLPVAPHEPPVLAMGALVRCSVHALREDTQVDCGSVLPIFDRSFRLLATLVIRLYHPQDDQIIRGEISAQGACNCSTHEGVSEEQTAWAPSPLTNVSGLPSPPLPSSFSSGRRYDAVR